MRGRASAIAIDRSIDEKRSVSSMKNEKTIGVHRRTPIVFIDDTDARVDEAADARLPCTPLPLLIRESSRTPSLWCVPPHVTGCDPSSARHGDVRPPPPPRAATDRPFSSTRDRDETARWRRWRR